MQKIFSRANDLVFLLAWLTIFFSENIHALTGIPPKKLLLAATVLVLASGALHFSAVSRFARRLLGRGDKGNFK